MIKTEDLEMCLAAALAAFDLSPFESAHEVNARLAKDAITAELHRRKHGPFTLAEAIASGRPFRRSNWKRYAHSLVDCDDGDGYMHFCFGDSPEPAYSDDIRAADYELMPEGGQ